MDTIKAEGYLTIEPDWLDERLMGAKIAKVTQMKPRGGSSAVGSAVVKLSIELPRRVFEPFEISAQVEASEGEVGVIKVVVEPFTEEGIDND